MKKLIFILALLLIVIFPQSICAITDTDSFLNNKYSQEKTGSAEINGILQQSFSHAKDTIFQHQSDYFNNKIKIENINDITFGTPYKVYMVGDLKKIKDNGKLTDNLAGYYWEVTVYLNSNGENKPISTIQFRKSDTEGWQLAMINGYLKPDFSDMAGDKSKFTSFLKGQDITRLDDCVHFQLDDMDFIYILSDGKEYIIPLNDNTPHMDAAKKYDYSVFKTYVSNLLANGDSTGGPSTEPDNVSGGSSTKSDDTSNTGHAEIYMICAAIVIGGIILFLIWKRVSLYKAFNHFICFVKKNKLLIILSVLFIIAGVSYYKINAYNNSVLFPIIQNGKTGYMNFKGKIIIKPKYNYGYAFTEGLAVAINNNDKYGFIDLKGDYVIEPKFEWAEPFQNGYAKVVTSKGEHKYINKKGIITVPPKNYEQNLMNSKGEGYKAVIDPHHPNNRLCGYVNSKGKLVIPYQFKLALDFSDGLALVETDYNNGRSFINKKGKIVLSFPEDYICDDYFYHGLLHIRINEKWTYVNHRGKIINAHY